MALRQQVWVDRSVQGVLVGRVILYWVCALLYVGIGSACFQFNQNPEWTLAKHAQVLFGQVWPWLPTAIILLPLAIYDVVRLSNLFAGPVCRLRKHFAALREDIACAQLTFREEDYWRDLAAPINAMQAEILRLRTGIIELQKVESSAAESNANSNSNTPSDADAEISVDENLLDVQNSSSVAIQSVSEEVVAAQKIEQVATVEPAADAAAVTIAPLPTPKVGEATLASPSVAPAN